MIDDHDHDDDGGDGRARREARQRLDTAAQTARPTTLALPALQALERLVRDPQLGEDARRLLHELLVHQHEIELQFDEFEHHRCASDAELARLRAAFDAAPVALVAVEPRGRVLRANRCALRLFGDRPLVGSALLHHLPPASRAAWTTALARTAAGVVVELEVAAFTGAQPWRVRVAPVATGGDERIVALMPH